MFGLGMPEILLILAIALIVIGPQKLPELAKTLGRALGEFKRSAQDLKRAIDIESTVNEPVPPPSKKVKDIIKETNAKNSAEGKDENQETESDTKASPEAVSPDSKDETTPKA
ncbi:MAG: hypothetical protein CSA29_05275 [Desulfobacterales bacterium]|nr:MAG: hypothetical protein CSA29_05275 [Desulfobacterales bacterium]